MRQGSRTMPRLTISTSSGCGSGVWMAGKAAMATATRCIRCEHVRRRPSVLAARLLRARSMRWLRGELWWPVRALACSPAPRMVVPTIMRELAVLWWARVRRHRLGMPCSPYGPRVRPLFG